MSLPYAYPLVANFRPLSCATAVVEGSVVRATSANSFQLSRYYADPAQPVVSQTAAPAEKPPKLSAEQLLEQAEAELGEQVWPSVWPHPEPDYCPTRVEEQLLGLQVDLTDGRGLKRLVLSFQRKVVPRLEARNSPPTKLLIRGPGLLLSQTAFSLLGPLARSACVNLMCVLRGRFACQHA